MGEVLTASTFEELQAALAEAEGGDTIALAGGDYGAGALKSKGDFSLAFASDVTIVSADPDDPAIFTQLTVAGAQNLVLDGVVFDYRFAEDDAGWVNPFGFYDNEGLTIRNSVFDGDVAQGVSVEEDGFGYGIGVVIRNSSDVVFENNEMFEFWKGIKVIESTDVTLEGNDIHSMRMDGINFAEVQGIVIENNHIHDFRRTTLSWDHSDMIQSWTANTDNPSTDIVIRGNTLDIGEGDATQSIFMGNTLVDRGEAGEEMYFVNVTIEDNLIINGQTHGIALGASIGVNISGNRVLHSDGNTPDGADGAVEIPRISVSPLSFNVVVTGNMAAEIRVDAEDRADWVVGTNIFVQDQDITAPNHYNAVFVSSTIEDHSFIPLPEGLAGPFVVLTPGALQVLFHAETDPENTAARTFDASYSLLQDQPLPEGAEYIWDFGDGTTASGLQVTHVFPDMGSYPVTLTVSLPGDISAQTGQTITLNDPVLVRYSAGDTIVLTADGFADAPMMIPDQRFAGIVLGAQDGPALTIPRDALADLILAENFVIDLGVTLTEGSTGTLYRFGRDINVWIDSDGDIRISVDMADGSVSLCSDGLNLADGAAHETSLRLTGGALEIWIDDVLVDSTSMTGPLADNGNHNFWLGTPWGNSVSGVIDSLSITANGENFLPDLQPAAQVALPFFDAQDDVFEFSYPEADGGDWQPVVDFSMQTGFMAYTADGPQVIDSIDIQSNTVLELVGSGVSGVINREFVDTLASSDGMRFAFTLQSDTDDSAGQLMNLSGSLSTYINADGNLLVRVQTQEHGATRYETQNIDLSDGQSHDIVVMQIGQQLEVMVDGVAVIEETLSSAISQGNSAGLLFGNTWGHQNFTGTLEYFSASSFVEGAETNARTYDVSDVDPFLPPPVDDTFGFGF